MISCKSVHCAICSYVLYTLNYVQLCVVHIELTFSAGRYGQFLDHYTKNWEKVLPAMLEVVTTAAAAAEPSPYVNMCCTCLHRRF